nr:hypothetical protein [Tanacetum cinerariifolium]
MVQTPARNHAQRVNHQHYARMTHLNPQRHVVPIAVLTRSKLVPLTAARPVTTTVPHNNVIRPRPAKSVGTKPHSPPRMTINYRPSLPASNFPLKVTTVKNPKVNVVKGVQGNWVLKPKCPILDHVSRHTSASMTLKKFDYTNALGRSKHVVPIAVLTRSKLVSLTAARPVTTTVPHNNVIRPRPAKSVATKPHSPPRMTINHIPSLPASNFPPKVTTIKNPKVNVVKGVQGNWVLKPKYPILDHVSRHTSASMTLKKFDYTDALGRSKSVMAWVPKRH